MTEHFITVVTKDVSPTTGKPKLFGINVAHIVTFEPTLFDVAYDMDHAETIEGTTLILQLPNHIMEIDVRDPFEHIMFRVANAGGVVDQTKVETETETFREHPYTMGRTE
jgi:hypothetical protein